MNIDRQRLALAIAGAALLGGCTLDPKTGELVKPQPELGEASRQTLMAQVVDPDPHYKEAAQTSGDQTARAIEAYREGKVEKPQAPSPTVSVGGSGSGGGSGCGSSGSS
jgi:type IV pilus biogenesis protein CpaD/CtpE